MLSLPLAAGKTRPALPQSTALALATGARVVESSQHPNSYVLRVWSSADVQSLCTPAEGMPCCTGDPWYVISSKAAFANVGGYRNAQDRPVGNEPKAWGRAMDTLIGGPSLSGSGKTSGRRTHQPEDIYLWATPANELCFAEWTGQSLVPFASGVAAPDRWDPSAIPVAYPPGGGNQDTCSFKV